MGDRAADTEVECDALVAHLPPQKVVNACALFAHAHHQVLSYQAVHIGRHVVRRPAQQRQALRSHASDRIA